MQLASSKKRPSSSVGITSEDGQKKREKSQKMNAPSPRHLLRSKDNSKDQSEQATDQYAGK
jgi:hypothetical protein